MTTDSPQASPAQNDEEQSFLPTLLAGAGILAVAALLIFWPSDDADSAKGGAGNGKAKTAAEGKSEGAEGKAGRPAGVGSRSIDAATPREGDNRLNPKIPPFKGNGGMAPAPEPTPKDPPESASTADKIAFYEKRLEAALLVRENRKKFAERLPRVKARIESSPNPQEGMRAFERRKVIVEKNYEIAKQDVEYIEGKLAELQP